MVATSRISSQLPRKTESTVEIGITTSSTVTFNRWRIFFLSALFAAVIFFLSLVFPLVPQFLEDVYKYNAVQIGILGSFTYFGESTLSLLVGKIGDKYGKTASISLSMIFVAFALSIFISVNNFATLMIAMFLRGASFPMWAFIGATVGAIAPPDSRARWISVVQTTTQVVSISAPYVGGILYTSSPQTPFLIIIAASLLLAFLAQIKPFKE